MGQLLIGARRVNALACVLALTATVGAVTQSELPSTAFGRDDAPVVLTVFSDFACEPCGHLAAVVQGVVEARPNAIRVVFRHLPAEDSRGRDAHFASLAAHQQGRFFDFHNLVFANQDRLSPGHLHSMAAQLGLDTDRFERERANAAWADVLTRDRNEAEQHGVSNTPAVLVNGVVVAGPLTLDSLLQRIDAARGVSPR